MSVALRGSAVGTFRKPLRAPVERLENRLLMSASEIGAGPPPTGDGPTATVVVLSPQESRTGTPHISVTINPPPVLTIPDKSPPRPPQPKEIVVVILVDKSSPGL